MLLIDDQDMMGKLVEMALAEDDALVVQVGGLDEALRAGRAQRPRAILLDVNLDDADGLALLPQLRSDPALAQVPVVVFTVHDSRRREAVELGADDFIAKPFKTDELREKLARYLA